MVDFCGICGVVTYLWLSLLSSQLYLHGYGHLHEMGVWGHWAAAEPLLAPWDTCIVSNLVIIKMNPYTNCFNHTSLTQWPSLTCAQICPILISFYTPALLLQLAKSPLLGSLPRWSQIVCFFPAFGPVFLACSMLLCCYLSLFVFMSLLSSDMLRREKCHNILCS